MCRLGSCRKPSARPAVLEPASKRARQSRKIISKQEPRETANNAKQKRGTTTQNKQETTQSVYNNKRNSLVILSRLCSTGPFFACFSFFITIFFFSLSLSLCLSVFARFVFVFVFSLFGAAPPLNRDTWRAFPRPEVMSVLLLLGLLFELLVFKLNLVQLVEQNSTSLGQQN